MKTGSESIDVVLRRRRRILFAGFIARMEDTRLPKKCSSDVPKTRSEYIACTGTGENINHDFL